VSWPPCPRCSILTFMNDLVEKQRNYLRLLCHFIGIFCRSRHDRERTVPLTVELSGLVRKQCLLCPDCAGLLEYAVRRFRSCPLDPKPSCKKCPVHCYRSDYRERIRKVMAWSGKRMILRGRIDLIRHYIF
jgi:hypothetical protein